MKITDGVEMLEIVDNIMGNQRAVCPTLIWDKDTKILIDTGFPGQLQLFRNAFENAGLDLKQLNIILLTHQDIDHIGTLKDFQNELSNQVKVLSHEIEKPYIEGEKVPVKLAQLEERKESLSGEMAAMYQRIKSGFQMSKARVDTTLTDGEELPYLGGISIIHTPGHTPGHICIYLNGSKVLIAGDVLAIDGGVLVPGPKHYNYDNKAALESLKKISNYDIDSVICYHGGFYNKDANSRIKEIANG